MNIIINTSGNYNKMVTPIYSQKIFSVIKIEQFKKANLNKKILKI